MLSENCTEAISLHCRRSGESRGTIWNIQTIKWAEASSRRTRASALGVRLKVSLVTQASPPASEGVVSPRTGLPGSDSAFWHWQETLWECALAFGVRKLAPAFEGGVRRPAAKGAAFGAGSTLNSASKLASWRTPNADATSTPSG